MCQEVEGTTTLALLRLSLPSFPPPHILPVDMVVREGAWSRGGRGRGIEVVRPADNLEGVVFSALR